MPLASEIVISAQQYIAAPDQTTAGTKQQGQQR